jgi:hypothetical protein
MAAKRGSDVGFNAPVLRTCGAHRHDPAVDELAEVVARHLGELLSRNQCIGRTRSLCIGHTVTFIGHDTTSAAS